MDRDTERTLTPEERHEIQVAAELIIAMSALPKSIPIDGRKVKGLAKSVVQYEAALLASEKRERHLREELTFYADTDNYIRADAWSGGRSRIRSDGGSRAREALDESI